MSSHSGDISLTLEERKITGKQVRALRRSGHVPAVIHNHGHESIIVNAPFVDMTKTYLAAGKHSPIDLTVSGKKYLALIKDVDLDPRKNTLRHVVFNAVRQNEKTITEVRVRLEGDSPAEKAGLMIIPVLDIVEVEALPRDLPEEMVVNIERLTDIGDKVTVADITAQAGVTILTEPEHTVATVEETKAQMSEEATTEESTSEPDTATEENTDSVQ